MGHGLAKVVLVGAATELVVGVLAVAEAPEEEDGANEGTEADDAHDDTGGDGGGVGTPVFFRVFLVDGGGFAGSGDNNGASVGVGGGMAVGG